MTATPEPGDHWDGWDDLDYQPTQAELNEPHRPESDPISDEVATALVRPRKR